MENLKQNQIENIVINLTPPKTEVIIKYGKVVVKRTSDRKTRKSAGQDEKELAQRAVRKLAQNA